MVDGGDVFDAVSVIIDGRVRMDGPVTTVTADVGSTGR